MAITHRLSGNSRLHEFSGTGCSAIGCVDSPGHGPGLASKPFTPLSKKKRKRAVQALLGEDIDSDEDNAPAPRISTPSPVPVPHAEHAGHSDPSGESEAKAPAWAAELIKQITDLKHEVAALKSSPADKPEQHVTPPTVPTSPRNIPTPPRAASAASAQVEDSHKKLQDEILRQMNLENTDAGPAMPSASPAAGLAASIDSGGAALGASLMEAAMPPPAPPSRIFIRPGM